MSRFQAQTNAVLDQELEDVRTRLGLDPSQKADLLREVASIAAWVLRQAQRGRTVEARRGEEVEVLDHPALARLRTAGPDAIATRLALTEEEVERLADVLARRFAPTPAMRTVLANLADPKRKPPTLRSARRA